MTNPNPSPQNPTLIELQALRKEFAALREEVAGVRADMKRPVNITDQVAKGVVIAGLFWFVVVFILQALFGAL